MDLYTAEMGWWRDGEIRIDFAHIQSDLPSVFLVGDEQVVSNLEASDASRLYSVEYEHRVGLHGRYRIGIIDLNAYFAVAEAALSLLNSSFGITPTISANVLTSIYPKPGYGFIGASIMPEWQFRAGVFQGDPLDRSSVFERGQMLIGEVVHSRQGHFGGMYKLGVWQYDNPQSTISVTQKHAWGLYGVVDQYVSRQASYKVSRVFLQFGANPNSDDELPYYVGVGADFLHPLPGRPNDRLSIGVARAWLRQHDAETTYEASYIYQFTPGFWLQPDIQYVRHPGGTEPDALVLLLRAYIALGE
jgi:porin